MPAIDRLMALAVCGVIVACVLAGGCAIVENNVDVETRVWVYHPVTVEGEITVDR